MCPRYYFLGSFRWLIFLLLVLASRGIAAQSCDCPPANACGACSGGLTGLTLKYNGASSASVTIEDNSGIFFSNTLAPGEEFSISGTLPNNRFQGPSITIKVAAVTNAVLSTNCSSPVFAGETYGSFKIVAGVSQSGGVLCCAPTSVESVPPVISNCPGDINEILGVSLCSKGVSWTVPTATDNCGLASFTSSHSPGEQFPAGVTTITYTATDNFGNTATCSFNIVITDNEKPKFTSCPADIVVSTDAGCEAVASWSVPTASDNCSIGSVTSNFIPGSSFPIGTTEVVYTASDLAGNTSKCSFSVVVNSNVDPVFSNCPVDIIVQANSSTGAIVSWTPPTATSSCGDLILDTNFSPGESFPIGETIVIYNAKQGGKNVQCSFKVTVQPSESGLVISKVLTPDGDGINDIWKIENIEQYNSRVRIVDRWGGLIYESENYNNSSVCWDGAARSGSRAPTGTYFYVMKVERAGVTEEYKGFIELIR